MKEIILTNGKVTLVDDEDYEYLVQYNWYDDGAGYVKSRNYRMHRVVMNCPKDKMVDHIDGNPLNNQKSNLRIVTQHENMQNKHRKGSNCTSKFFGVSHDKKANTWATYLTCKGIKYFLGCYKTEEEAAVAFNIKAEELGVLTRNNVDMTIPLHRLKIGDWRLDSITFPGFIDPEGVIYSPISDILLFCREHSLNYHSIVKYKRGHRVSYKGWTILYA
jgi:hypothetical protein